MPEFYCRTLPDRIAALHELVGYCKVQDWLDEIANGCGGCERASFGTHDGKVRWITVLGSEDGRTLYASIVTESYGEGAAIERVTYGSFGFSGEFSEDCPARYAEFATMVDDDERSDD